MKKKSKLQVLKTILQIIFLLLLILSALPALFGKAAAADFPVATSDNADFIEQFSQPDNSEINNIFDSEFLSKVDTSTDLDARAGRYFFGFQYEVAFMKSFDIAVSTPGWVEEMQRNYPERFLQYVDIYNDCKRNVYIGAGLIIGFTALLCIPFLKLLKVF